MAQVENVVQVKNLALDFLAKMGVPTWSNEIDSIKKVSGNWVVLIKIRRYGTNFEEAIKLEIETETGNVITYERIK
ncbi:MAG: hypothetical protein C3F06_02770 [Candidatus Methanoperedenaceae archaeon]|nr:MAG: hypothetical protein C3F06_02770 [Candidatus Methanoperedenaceae archaeon]